MTVFIDTFALIAWLNPRDNAHESVAKFLNDFAGRLLTTEWVLMELADALSSPEARSSVIAFLQEVRSDSQFEIVGYLPDVYQAGFDIFAARQDKSWSLTDCISFAAMSSRKVFDVLTADHHFEQAGFNIVFN
jgi:predicted nucleic acid-binding protein